MSAAGVTDLTPRVAPETAPAVAALDVRNVSHAYGSRQALKDVSLRIQKTFAMPNEKGKIAISAEMFNLFNFADVQLAGAAFTYGNAGTLVQNGSLVQVGPQNPAVFGQLRNPATGQYYTSNAAGDPFQAQLGLRFQF